MSSIPDNKWDRVFSTNREFREDWSRAYVDRFRDIDADCDGIEIFLQEYEDFGLEDKVEELKAFVGEVTLRDLEQGVGAAGLCNRAWLDERCITGERRDHKNPFTAAQLYKRRQTPVSFSYGFLVRIIFKAYEMTIASWSEKYTEFR
jgi:hypothetical protein